MSEQPEATGAVRLADGTTARVLVAPLTLTALTVPTTVTTSRPTLTVRGRALAEALPILTPRAIVAPDPHPPAGSVSQGLTYVQRTPLLVWRFTHPLGRRPQVSVFYGLDDDAEQATADVDADVLHVVVTWAEPAVGSVVLR